MINRTYRALALAAVLCFVALAAAGCFGKVIVEDGEQLALSDVDPEDGIERSASVTLYYRLTNEKYLVGVNRSISVRAGERTETAVIRTLIEGVPLLATNVSALFPEGTKIVDISYENDILYVTFSEEILYDGDVASLEREDYLSDDDYDRAVSEATSEMYLKRRLAVLSVVNTVVGSDGDAKVQIMVDNNGSGSGSRMPYETFGFEERSGGIMEPMGFDGSVVATPEKVAGCLLERMVNGQYEMAYPLIAESDYTGEAKPAYADFETEMMSCGRLESYEITGLNRDEYGTYALAELRIASPDGTVKRVSNAKLYLEDEGDLYKVGYGSLKALMES